MNMRFADAAVLAYWDGRGEETAPRTIAVGPPAIGHAFASVRRQLEVLREVRVGADGFVEGLMRARSGAVTGTFVASLQFDADGAITRCLCFHGPAVEPPEEGRDGPPPGTGRTTLDLYFERLIAGDFDAAAACFSADCLYSHPPYRPGTARIEFRGREQLRRGFEQKRGARPVRPRIICCVQRGPSCFIEGIVDGDRPGGSFVSSATLDPDGLIRRYVAFYTTSRVPAGVREMPERSGVAHWA